jgi:hypothetical protein
VILKLMARTRRDSHTLPGQQDNPLTVNFHGGLPGQDKEKLLSISVEVTHL